jgi:hypothetical protein
MIDYAINRVHPPPPIHHTDRSIHPSIRPRRFYCTRPNQRTSASFLALSALALASSASFFALACVVRVQVQWVEKASMSQHTRSDARDSKQLNTDTLPRRPSSPARPCAVDCGCTSRGGGKRAFVRS